MFLSPDMTCFGTEKCQGNEKIFSSIHTKFFEYSPKFCKYSYHILIDLKMLLRFNVTYVSILLLIFQFNYVALILCNMLI